MSEETRFRDVSDLRTSLLFDIVVDLDARQAFGDGPRGRRVFFPAKGGRFVGPQLRGTVLPGGGDWALFGPDGTMALDVRLSLRTHDDAHVLMTYGGRWTFPPEIASDMADPSRRYAVDPSRYYFRTAPLFETGAAAYRWMNGIVCVATGYLVEGGVAYRVSRVM